MLSTQSVVLDTACLRAFGKTPTQTSNVHAMLHNCMAEMRTGVDSGMSPEDSIDDNKIRHKREEMRLRAILQMNMGSAMGMASASELLSEGVLPPCSRWGDQVLQQYAVRGFGKVSLESVARLASDTRPKVPGPLQITTPGERMGPHAAPRMLRAHVVPICSYGQKVEQARAMAASALTASFSAGISIGLDVIDADEYDSEDSDVEAQITGVPRVAHRHDRAADAENGERVWPPLAMSSSGSADETNKTVKQIIEVFDALSLSVDKKLLAAVSGVYTSSVEFVLVSESLQPAHRDAFSALGLGATGGLRADVERAGERARILAAAAHAMGHHDLGDAFTRLADGPIADCARKPWV